jgi:hypothetical protein
MRILSVSVFINFLVYAADASMTAANNNYLKIAFQALGALTGAGAGYMLINGLGAPGAACTDMVIRCMLLAPMMWFAYKKKYLSVDPIVKLSGPIILVLLCGVASVCLMPHAIFARPAVAGLASAIIVLVSIGPKKLKNIFLFFTLSSGKITL